VIFKGIIMRRDMSVYDKRRGFTLIEMLVVIVIIMILSGMVLKIMTLVSRKAGISRCAHDLLQLENALAEFYSEYGQYPPGLGDPKDNVEYEFENSYLQPPWFRDTFLPGHSNVNDKVNFFPDVIVYKDEQVPRYLEGISQGHLANPSDRDDPDVAKWGLGYRYGLASYLWKRDMQGSSIYGAGQKHWYRRDTDRDIASKERWASFLTDVKFHARDWDDSAYAVHKAATGSGTPVYSNVVYTIYDPWDRGYYYECKPPYFSYKLWSIGPDRQNNTKDDIYAGKSQ
jgi:prepilin-type N-terminal cleavage/methylation domain-containing protein